jgi:hypothetical protein
MRVVLPLVVFATFADACASTSRSAPVPVVDFIKELDRAELRPASAYAIAESRLGGSPVPAIVGPSPGRLTWTLPVPRHASLQMRIAVEGAPVRVRLGVSDARIYEQLLATTITPGAGWTPLSADLSAYAGWKVSLFYRPDGQKWRINFSADTMSGPATIAWGIPAILASREDALEYAARRERLTRSGAP